MKKILFYSLAVLFVLSLFLSGCSSSSSTTGNTTGTPKTSSNSITKPAAPRGTTGKIVTSTPVQAASGNIAASGGVLAVTASGTPITGLTLVVPANAYPAAHQFSISYAPIKSHTFGELFKPATPMISINNGGEMASTYIQVKIPIKVPDGSIAMGFLYDDQTHTLEGLPTLAQDADSITVGTRHFSNIILSLINRSLLKPDIDSDFRPGIDDWQFQNVGSYIAQKGHCTGQSMTAMWYYIEQPDGAGLTLNGRYDNNGDQPATPNFWQDDSLGYRFASVVWKDMDWGSLSRSLTEGYIASDDQDTFDLFRYSMQLTKQPQMTEIWDTATGGGHAMVVYRIMNGNLYIADPNWPGNENRSIAIVNGKFEPYESGENAAAIAAGNSEKYDKITYVAKTSLVDWKSIGMHWAELKAKTIGNGIFPSYKIVWTDDKNQDHELTDGYISTQKLIDINGIVNNLQAGEKSSIGVYRDGNALTWDAKGNYELNPGVNKLGIEVDVDVPAKDKNGNPITESKYVDFKYINIIYSDLAIDPATINGQVNKEYTFTANLKNPPANVRFSWSADGSILQTDASNTFKTTFKTEGNHTITVKVLDATGKELGQAQSTANIKTVTSTTGAAFKLEDLQKMTHLKGNFDAQITIKDFDVQGTPSEKTSQRDWSFPFPAFGTTFQSQLIITWNGTSFSGISMDTPNSGVTNSVNGTVSPDGHTLVTLSYQSQYKLTGPDSPGYTEDKVITLSLHNVPLSKVTTDFGPGMGYWSGAGSWTAEGTWRDTHYYKDKITGDQNMVSIDKLTGCHFAFLP